MRTIDRDIESDEDYRAVLFQVELWTEKRNRGLDTPGIVTSDINCAFEALVDYERDMALGASSVTASTPLARKKARDSLTPIRPAVIVPIEPEPEPVQQTPQPSRHKSKPNTSVHATVSAPRRLQRQQPSSHGPDMKTMFKGKRVYVSGRVSGLTKAEAKAHLNSLGAIWTTSQVYIDYIIGDSSAKVTKIASRGATHVTVKEFMMVLEQNGLV